MLVTKLTAVLNDRAGVTFDHVGRVERQVALEPLHHVEQEDADDAEREERDRVDVPALLALGIDPAEPVDEALDRTEDAVEA